jgi:hypothetical protein
VLNPNAYGTRTFENDLLWERDRAEALSCLEQADILHFHHYFELNNNQFNFDFTKLNKICVRQFHSSPLHITGGNHAEIKNVINSSIAQLVITQYPERYFPNARLVPNLVPLENPEYKPLVKCSADADITIFFAPSSNYSAWEFSDPMARWATKGAPETITMLLHLAQALPKIKVDIRRDIPHAQCLGARQHADISIDELVTGSFHLSSLEGMAQGVPTLAYLDGRTRDVLAQFTGTNNNPWINCCLEAAPDAIKAMVKDPEFRLAKGREVRVWMERYWNDSAMVKHYVDAYETLIETNGARFPTRFDLSKLLTKWQIQTQHDLAWRIRRFRQKWK